MSDRGRASKLSNFKLKTLLEITQLINSNVDTGQLLDLYRKVLEIDLNVGKCMLFDIASGGQCLLRFGYSEEAQNKVNPKEEIAKYDSINTVPGYEPGNEKEFDIVVPVYHNDQPFAFLIVGDIDEEEQGLSPIIKHLRFIQTLTNIILVAIENKKLYQESLRQVAMKRELELAARMQNALIPLESDFPNISGLRFSAFYLPHLEVGGDYYDLFQLDQETVGFCIADVSGKGVAAAMLMSNFQASIRALFTNTIPLEELIEKLNQLINRNARGEKFITLFLGRIRLASLEMEYVNAAHVYPILYRPGSNDCIELKTGCIGIGMLDEIFDIQAGKVQLEPGSKILCFTDGITEFRFGENTHENLNFEQYLSGSESIDQIIHQLELKINELKALNAIFDDISILGIEVDRSIKLNQ